MDFIGIIRSLEELLYEVMSWLIFYPRTLWRTLTNPAAVTAYSDAEQNDRPDEQYTDTLSPPLLLMITMVLGGLWHGAAISYVIWGALHGLFLILHRQFRVWCEPRPKVQAVLNSWPGTVWRIGFTFTVVSLA